jgi:2-dehydropantoate 2-reductase
MNACVVGAGAIGTFIGAQLARNGCEVSALARGATAAALRAHGFRFQQDGGVLTAPVRVAEDAVTASRSRSWRRPPPSASGSAARSVRAVKSGTR